jgi:predicted transcriptional regulator
MLKRFSIWLESKTIEELKRIAKQQDRPVGWVIRKAVEDAVERTKQGA